MSKVLQALHAVMADIGAVEKGGVNKFQKYRYRSIDDCMAALQPLLVKHRLLMLPSYKGGGLRVDHEGDTGMFLTTVECEVSFVSVDDGGECRVVFAGQGADKGDKGLYKAFAGALKYAITQTFCIPTEGAKDAEADSPVLRMPQAEVVKQAREWLLALGAVKTTKELDALRKKILDLPPAVKNELRIAYAEAEGRLS